MWRGMQRGKEIHEELIVGNSGDTTCEVKDGVIWMRRIESTGKSLGFFSSEELIQVIDSQEAMAVYPLVMIVYPWSCPRYIHHP